MFTQKLTAWREKQRSETAWFQGKIQVEKSGGNLGHIYHVTPQQHLSPLAASSDEGGHFHCNHNIFTRFGRTQRTAPPSQGGQWGARRGTPGSKVGNPGERGGEPRGARWGATWSSPREPGGEPRGAGWGARWRNTERLTQHHRAGNLRWIRWNVSARIRHNHMRHIKVGRPGLPARPTSSAVCVRRQSLSFRLSQRRS